MKGTSEMATTKKKPEEEMQTLDETQFKDGFDKLGEQAKGIAEQVESLSGMANDYLAQLQQKEAEVAKVKTSVTEFIEAIQNALYKVQIELGL